ncbi:MAG: SGNH/GDSL hydrolase family protein [Lachnospiraceae bacterium]
MSTKKSILSYIGILAGVCICIAATIFFYGMHQKQNIKNIGNSAGNSSENNSEIGSENSAEAKGPLQILVLGDSIWDLVRDDTGVAALLEKELGNAMVYNLAIKGSQAADTGAGDAAGAETDSGIGAEDTSLIAMTEYITGKRECALPDDVEAKNILPEVPYEEMDYVILAYGLNDYFAGVKQKNPNDYYDVTTYSGALCSGVMALQEVCPDAVFVIVSPTYCQGYSYGQVIHESTSHDFGGGTLIDYTASAKAVSASFNAIFINSYDDMNISIHNGEKYLIDATHLTEYGRKKYAENVANYIAEHERQR